ncbi:MAG: helix-turn-helix domain-containing protein, partial [Anaerolineae bacterium]|nr:helix-turn-helix domain-containing protein [Anaerolineae bacterium]
MGREPYKYRIRLSGKEKQELRQAKKKGYKEARLVIRILIILWADQGRTIAQTAALLGCCEQTVLNWRKRFLERRSEGPVAALMDLPRSGRPPLYSAQQRVQIVAIV